MAGRYKVSPKEARTINGVVFDSKAEARRYEELRMLERIGSVTDIELQPVYVLLDAFEHFHHGKIRGITYRADFRYKHHGKVIVEDVKGHKTDVFNLKKKLLLARYPEINFKEVDA